MDKKHAEAILELTEPYDYASLRRQWRDLCMRYHPDKSNATGMDSKAANEVLKDINEAFGALKPLVECGATIYPDRNESPQGQEEEPGPSIEELAYQEAVDELSRAVSIDDFEAAQFKFETLGGYRDSSEKARMCQHVVERMQAAAAEAETEGVSPPNSGDGTQKGEDTSNVATKRASSRIWGERGSATRIRRVLRVVVALFVATHLAVGYWISNNGGIGSPSAGEASNDFHYTKSELVDIASNEANLTPDARRILKSDMRISDEGEYSAALKRIQFGTLWLASDEQGWYVEGVDGDTCSQLIVFVIMQMADSEEELEKAAEAVAAASFSQTRYWYGQINPDELRGIQRYLFEQENPNYQYHPNEPDDKSQVAVYWDFGDVSIELGGEAWHVYWSGWAKGDDSPFSNGLSSIMKLEITTQGGSSRPAMPEELYQVVEHR